MEVAVAAPERLITEKSIVRLLREDITEMEVDAFVYYAQPDLNLGSGFGGAIAVRGGASIQKELNELAKAGPLPTGTAVVTGAGKLKAKGIIHAVGPRFREPDTERKLRNTMEACLDRAREEGFCSLAFPLMGSGYYGISPSVSARVMLQALSDHLSRPSNLREVLICALDTPQFNAFQAALAAHV